MRRAFGGLIGASGVALAVLCLGLVAPSGWAQSGERPDTSPSREREATPRREAPPTREARPRRELTPEEQAERERRIRELRSRQAQPGAANALRRPPADPWIEFDPPELDFGFVDRLTEQKGVVKIKNIHSTQITLRQPTAGCSCTVPELPKLVIEPGETVDMSVQLSIGYNLGAVNKSVNVQVEGQTGMYTIPVRAHATYAVKATPSFLTSGRVDRSGPMSGSIALESTDGRPFRVLSANGKEPVIISRQGETDDGAATSYRLEYTLEPGNIPPLFLIETDHPAAPLLDLRVTHADVLAEERNWRNKSLKLLMPSANAGVLKAGGSTEIVLQITNTEREQTGQVDVRADFPGVKAEFDHVEMVEGYKGRVETHAHIKLIADADVKTGTAIIPLFIAPKGKELDTRIWVAVSIRPDAEAVSSDEDASHAAAH